MIAAIFMMGSTRKTTERKEEEIRLRDERSLKVTLRREEKLKKKIG